MTEENKRLYNRSSGSLLCIICKQYHQKKKNGKCNNIHSELSIITEFMKENDLNTNTTLHKTKEPITELSIRRLFGILYEHREEFQVWSKETNIELKAESYDLNTITSEKLEDSKTIKKRKGSEGENNNNTITSSTSSTSSTSTSTSSSKTKTTTITSEQELNRAPPLLSYEFLKSIPDIQMS